MKTDMNIKAIAVLAQLSNGKFYNVLCQKETQQLIISTINLAENGIQLLDTPIEGIEISKPFAPPPERTGEEIINPAT